MLGLKHFILDINLLKDCYICYNTFKTGLMVGLKIQKIGVAKKIHEGKIVIIFLSISLNICFRCSKEPSH